MNGDALLPSAARLEIRLPLPLKVALAEEAARRGIGMATVLKDIVVKYFADAAQKEL